MTACTAPSGVIPPTLWIVLFFISAVIFAYMLFFADSGEGAVTQGMLMGAVASVITVMLLLLWSLDDPFHTGVGGLKPVAMERSLRMLDEVLRSFAPGHLAAVRRSRGDRSERGRRERPSRAGRDRPARARDGRDGLERLPGEPLERRGRRRRRSAARAARLESTTRVRPRQRPGADRRRGLHAVGQRLRARARSNSATSTSSGSGPSSSPPWSPGSRRDRSRTPNAPLTPFAMPQYTSKAREDAARLEAQADAWAATARRNVQRSTNYVLGVVLFASALFFAGMSTKLPSPAARPSRCSRSARRVRRSRSSGSRRPRSASPSEPVHPPVVVRVVPGARRAAFHVGRGG